MRGQPVHVLGQLEAEVALLAAQLVEGRLDNQVPLRPDQVLRLQLLEAFVGLATEEQRKVRAKEDRGDSSTIAIHLIPNRANCHIDLAERALMTEGPSTEDLQETLKSKEISIKSSFL